VGGILAGSEIEPFATFINGVAKHVATSAPLEPQWTNAHVIDGDLVEFARRLKDGPGGDIGVHGSISVAQALLAGGIVDELRLVIAPSMAGGGRRLLDGLPSIQLESIRSEISPTGYLLVRLSRYSLTPRLPDRRLSHHPPATRLVYTASKSP
jgi:dihydrofolate reductase